MFYLHRCLRIKYHGYSNPIKGKILHGHQSSTAVDTITETISNYSSNITTQLEIIDTTKFDKWKTFRILDPTGRVLEKAVEPLIEKSMLLNMYKMVVRIQALDDIFYNAQRQGRISFYMQSTGEECIHIGKSIVIQIAMKSHKLLS